MALSFMERMNVINSLRERVSKARIYLGKNAPEVLKQYDWEEAQGAPYYQGNIRHRGMGEDRITKLRSEAVHLEGLARARLSQPASPTPAVPEGRVMKKIFSLLSGNYAKKTA